MPFLKVFKVCFKNKTKQNRILIRGLQASANNQRDPWHNGCEEPVEVEPQQVIPLSCNPKASIEVTPKPH